jgi:plasmid stabilization system protein ParE
MTKPWRTRAEAEREIEEATTWYEEQQPGLGEEFADAIAAAIDRLSVKPQIAVSLPRARGSTRSRRYLLPRFPYALVILELEHEYQIIAVAHLKRRPNYWTRRLKIGPK